MKLRIVAITFLVFLTVSAAPTPAISVMNPAAICESAKLATSGKYAACWLKIASKAAARHEQPFFEICERKFIDKWSTIEAKGGSACPTHGDADTISAMITAATRKAKTRTSSSLEMVPCASVRQKILANYMNCVFAVYGKARKTALDVNVGGCASKLDRGWTSATNKFPSMCSLASSYMTRSDLDVRVAQIAERLTGAPPPQPPAPPVCGDGKLNQASEECDAASNLLCPSQCRADCTCPNEAGRVELIANIAEVAGLPVHEGLGPTTGQPVAGETTYILAKVLGPDATASFRLLDSNNNLLQTLNLEQNNPQAPNEDYVGTVTVPAQPFRIAVSGATRDGSPYDLVGDTLFRPQLIKLKWDPFSMERLSPGGSSAITFRLFNYGPSGTFGISASDTLGLAPAVNPATTTLATGEAADITVSLSAASTVEPWSPSSLTVTATNATNPSSTNAVTVLITVK